MRLYAEDLAYIHDIGFSDFARRAAPAILDLMSAAGVHAGLIVELGCAGGVLARALHRAGFDVLGIDVSVALIDVARRRAPKAGFRVASLHRAPLPRCDAVISIGECVCYTGSRDSAPSIDRLFRRVWKALRPGGLFIFDVHEPAPAAPSGPHHAFRQGGDWAVFAESRQDSAGRTLTRRITTFRRVNGLYRRGAETHVLRLYRGSELAARLRALGFRVRLRRGYGDLRLEPNRIAIIARKLER